MKSISVVIPIYNMEAYLRKCLDSLYAQVDNTMEVILVNDGSTDTSPQICAEYIKRYPDTKYINKKNGGLSDARNEGIKVATGRYIYFLDSDDWLAPNAIRTLYDFAESAHCEMVQGGFYYAFDDHLEYDDRKISIDAKPFVLNKMEAMTELVKHQYVKNFAWGKLYKTDIVRNHPFKKGVYYEDAYWQHLIIDETSKYGVISTPLYYYRQRSGGISGNFSLRNMDLLLGYEQRLLFFQQHYPSLVKPFAVSSWRQSLQFHQMSKYTQDANLCKEFNTFWERINCEYRSLFNQALRYNVTYQMVKRLPNSASVCLFTWRVYDHFFAKRLKRINCYQ